MSESVRISLDNQVFAGRLGMPRSTVQAGITSETRPSAKYFNQSLDHQFMPRLHTETVQPLTPVWAKPMSVSGTNHQAAAKSNAATANASIAVERTEGDKPEAVPDTFGQMDQLDVSPPPEGVSPGSTPRGTHFRSLRPRMPNYSRTQWVLVTGAMFIFVAGVLISLQGLMTNHGVTAQVAALSKKANSANDSNGVVPSTNKPSTNAFSQYMVAPDLPRYIKIPSLGVNARVMQTGVTNSGALGTPSNVYDTAWYTGSAKPGQPGATLIDGHVSSWTAHGVFYNLKNLRAGDTIQIQRGDGQVLTYQVVKTQVYSVDNVDMQAAMTPVVAGKSGLNLITCTGKVKPGTSEFNQRIVVFAEQT